MEKLIENLKREIVKSFKLENIRWDAIDTDAPLFVEGLGLDSIDALELMVILEKNYGLKITSSEEGKKIMYSIKTIAEYIRANKKDVL
jgi:acyl carrier protein